MKAPHCTTIMAIAPFRMEWDFKYYLVNLVELGVMKRGEKKDRGSSGFDYVSACNINYSLCNFYDFHPQLNMIYFQ